jgi:hypothetical protein
MTTPEFDWNVYGQTVLQNFDHIQNDIKRIRDHIDRLQATAETVAVMLSELGVAKKDLIKVEDELDRLKDTVVTCQKRSITKDGTDNTAMALLAKDVKTQATTVSIIVSFAITLIGSVIVLLITHFTKQ